MANIVANHVSTHQVRRLDFRHPSLELGLNMRGTCIGEALRAKVAGEVRSGTWKFRSRHAGLLERDLI